MTKISAFIANITQIETIDRIVLCPAHSEKFAGYT